MSNTILKSKLLNNIVKGGALTLRCSTYSVFQSCCSIDEHLRGRKGQQPYILAAGRTQNKIDNFLSSLTNSSSPAMPPASKVLLMNFSNHTTCSTCHTKSPWSSSTHLCRQQSTTSMSQQQTSLLKNP